MNHCAYMNKTGRPCQQQVDPKSEQGFCYYHQKVMDGLIEESEYPSVDLPELED